MLKWKKLAAAPKNSSKKSINNVPKGFFTVCVGEEMKRFVIPTEYLHHRAFIVLLRAAEEEYRFQQEGMLRIPCGVHMFQSIMEAVYRRRRKGSATTPLNQSWQATITCITQWTDDHCCTSLPDRI